VALAVGGGVLLTSTPTFAQSSGTDASTQRIEVTGSRIKRVDAEGALPVTTITAEEIAASGATSVAEFMRSSTFSSSGNFRPQSGSSAQSWAGIDLRGLGAARTLVLLDGRRLPKAPMIGDAADLNAIPLAAVERIEILTDGASAVYGSDAIGGVVNIITKKNFEGGEAMIGFTAPESDGGRREEASAVIGIMGEKGRALLGVSYNRRGMVYTSQRPWGQDLGVSTYGNNLGYYAPDGTVGDPDGNPDFVIQGLAGGCEPNPNFYTQASGRCSFNFNAIAADEASIKNQSFFLRGDTQITDDWSAYLQGSVSNVKSFGRYAPTPGVVAISPSSPQYPLNDPAQGIPVGTDLTQTVYLFHRFAAAGNRDTSTDNSVYDVLGGVQGTWGKVDLDVGARLSRSQYFELGRNYIVGTLAEQAINDGTYNIYRPYDTPEDVLNSIKATINRDAYFKQTEAYVNATLPVFELPGGTANLAVGGEWRKEEYQDQYDSLQESGVILGSAGNSAGGDRFVKAVYSELLLPVVKDLDVTLAARYEKYSDYGSDFSPKLGVEWKAMPELKFRGSVGRGFRAPSLPILTSKTSFSAESVIDFDTCVFQTGGAAGCATDSIQTQVDTYYQSNPELKSEKSTQFSFGLVADPTPWLSVKADYWHIKIKDVITQITAQQIIDIDNGDSPGTIPPGLGITRAADGHITRIDAGYANFGKLKTDGLDLNLLANYKLGGYGSMRHDFTYSRVFNYTRDSDEFVGTLGYPKQRASLANTYTISAFDLQYNINYIGRNGEDSSEVGAYITHDVQGSWNTPWKGKISVGIVNLTDRMPALVDYEGRPFNFYLYDSYGRQYYARYTQRF